METLAAAISTNANKIADVIRTKLSEESESRVKPIIDESIDGTDVFITLSCAGYILTQNEKTDALLLAENKLIELISSYDFENQLNRDSSDKKL